MATRTRPRGGKHRRGFLSTSNGSRKARTQQGFIRRFWWVFVLVPLVVVIGLLGTLWYVYAVLPIPNEPPAAQTTMVYDRHGKLVTKLHGEVNRTEIPLSDMPQPLRDAVVSVEDQDFYRHGGISVWGILRAAWVNVTSGEIEQGGSTITQQYVKNVYVGSERTIWRKLKEAILAVKIDKRLSKDQILEKYLNAVYFGNGAYGVQAAAQTYFGLPARRLSVLQSATLAGLISAPEAYDPSDNRDRAAQRRNVVLDLMVEQGYLDRAEAEDLKARPVKVRRPRTQSTSRHAYFVDLVRRELLSSYGAELTYGGGLRVRTTLDSGWQQAAEDAVEAHLPNPGDPSAALVAIDPRNGALRALVGGKNFDEVKFNNAFQARRQPGSAFKPFTLAAAFEQRISPNSTWRGPARITIPDEECYTNGEPWQPGNYGDASTGTMSLIDATAYSVNTIYAQLVVEVGPESVADVAERMGIQSELNPHCSITLGTQEVTPLEMTVAYSTLAARGVRHEATPFVKVSDASGEVLDEPKPEGRSVLEENDADLVTFALEAVVAKGTGTAADIGRPVAGKTGTAQDYTNAWFCGYTPQLATCVWVGHQKGNVPMENVAGFGSVTGGSIPALIWHDFMAVAMEGQPVMDFPKPSLEGYDKGRPSPSPVVPEPTFEPSPSPIEPSPLPTEEPSPSPSPPPIEPSPLPTLPTEEPSPSPSPSPTGTAASQQDATSG